MKLEKIDRRDFMGRITHTDYYDGIELIYRSADRTDLSTGKYSHTDYYDKYWHKIGKKVKKERIASRAV